jgi:hypothetical protein
MRTWFVIAAAERVRLRIVGVAVVGIVAVNCPAPSTAGTTVFVLATELMNPPPPAPGAAIVIWEPLGVRDTPAPATKTEFMRL